MNLVSKSSDELTYLYRTEIKIFTLLVIYDCVAQTLSNNIMRRSVILDNKCLRRILGIIGVTLRETSECSIDSRPVACIVREQLRLYGHVARFLKLNPTHQVVSVKDSPKWRRARERPQEPWLKQDNKFC